MRGGLLLGDYAVWCIRIDSHCGRCDGTLASVRCVRRPHQQCPHGECSHGCRGKHGNDNGLVQHRSTKGWSQT